MSNLLAGLSQTQIHQMVFIFNAVMAGWNVRKVESTGNLLFKKRIQTPDERKTYQQEGFLQKFMQNMQKLQVVDVRSAQIESFELTPQQDVFPAM